MAEYNLPLEVYLKNEPEYNPDRPSEIKGYQHPKFRHNDHLSNYENVSRIHADYVARMEPGIAIEIQELVLQTIANWPNLAVPMHSFIEARANVFYGDAMKAIVQLEREGILERDHDIKPIFEYSYNDTNIIQLHRLM